MSLRNLILSGGRRAKSQANETTQGAISDDSKIGKVPRSDTPSEDPVPVSELKNLDHTTAAALRRQILSEDQLRTIDCSGENSRMIITWRQCSFAFPDVREQLQKLAAEIYGFRPVTVCQIGTLIYNNKLLDLLSSEDWTSLFACGVVPVIEHGHYPDVVRRHLLASSDPGSRRVRALSDRLILSDIEFVFVPEEVVNTVQNLLISNMPALNVNPGIARNGDTLKRETTTQDYTRRRAA